MTSPNRRGAPPGRRRVNHAPEGRMLEVLDPVPEGPLLPGEAAPLVYEAGRTHPVTDEEALGTLRRLARLKAQHMGVEPELPEALPSPLAVQEKVVLNLSPYVKALLTAHALIEGTNFARLMEGLALERLQQPPREPALVRRHHEELLEQLLGPARQQAERDEQLQRMRRLRAELDAQIADLESDR